MLKADTPTIEEIRKAIDMVDRSGGEYYPSSELAVYYIRVLFAELKKRDDEAVRLKAENQYVCPHWSEPPQGTPIEILDKMGHALASLTSQDIDEKGKEVWRHFWQLDERLRVGQQPVALRIRAQDSERGFDECSTETETYQGTKN